MLWVGPVRREEICLAGINWGRAPHRLNFSGGVPKPLVTFDMDSTSVAPGYIGMVISRAEVDPNNF
jgi:hypothetical protein